MPPKETRMLDLGPNIDISPQLIVASPIRCSGPMEGEADFGVQAQ